MSVFSPLRWLLPVLAVPLLAAPVLIPIPEQITEYPDAAWTKEMGLRPVYSAEVFDAANGWVNGLLNEAGIDSVGTEWAIELIDTPEHLGEEGYVLVTGADRWELKAHTTTGLFYGIQTVRQLLAAGGSVPALEIVDKPAVTWRGLMLDAARNFLGLDFYKKAIDQMATLKMNRLHLHLSDDQGWRLEIKAYPELTITGSESSVGGTATHGFLTQKQWKELVDYGAARSVVLVPEFDFPGHTHAVRATYPSLGCGKNYSWPYREYEVGYSYLCWNDDGKEFISTVLTELAEITPGPWIHIGGDELYTMPSAEYKASITFMEDVVNRKGKTIIAWEEGAKGYQNDNSIQQIWQQSTSAGVPYWINSRCCYAYLDHSDGGSHGGAGWMSWCGTVPTQTTYSIQPGTVGVEGALWSEMVPTPEVAEEKLYPRLIALAEVGWSPTSKKNYTQFTQRLSALTESWFRQAILIPDSYPSSLSPRLSVVRGTPLQHRIYTLDGRLVATFAAQEGETIEATLGLGLLPPGAYLVRTRYTRGSFSERAIHIR